MLSRRHNPTSRPSQGLEKPQCLSACLEGSRKSNPQEVGAARIINIQAEAQAAAGWRFPARNGSQAELKAPDKPREGSKPGVTASARNTHPVSPRPCKKMTC